jgi:hypothetical protein
MEAIGQLHALAALLPGIDFPVLVGKEAGWATEPVLTLWRREKPYVAGNRTQTVKPEARNPSLYD